MRTYLKAFLFLALTASIACAGANFAQAAETAPAASAGKSAVGGFSIHSLNSLWVFPLWGSM